MQRATSRLHSDDSTATPLGRRYSAKKLCHSATFPEASNFLVRFCTQSTTHAPQAPTANRTIVAGRASKLLFCWKNLHDLDLYLTLPVAMSCHETPHTSSE